MRHCLKRLLTLCCLAPFIYCASAFAQEVIQPPLFSVIDQHGVNLATGKFVIPGMDLGIGSNDSRSALARMVNENSDNFAGTLSFSFMPMTSAGAGMLFMHASYNGEVNRFVVGGGNSEETATMFDQSAYSQQNGVALLTCIGDRLQRYSDGTCTMRLRDGTSVHYGIRGLNSPWYIQSVTKPDGEVLEFVYYQANGKAGSLKSVSSSLGWMLKYESDSSTRKITAINTASSYCDPNATSCSVSGSYPQVTSSTSGGITEIHRNGTKILSYTNSGNVRTITSPSGVTKTLTYSGSNTTGKIASVGIGSSTWTYTYSGNTTTITNPDSTTYNATVGPTGLISTTDETGLSQSIQYETAGGYFNAAYGRVTRTSATNSPYTIYGYDNRGNVISASTYPYGDGTPLVEIAVYPSTCNNIKTCNKPTSVTKPNGLTVGYTYDEAHGGILTETTSSVDGIEIQTRYGYQQYTPYIKNISGSLVAQPSVWRLTSTSSCMTSSLDYCEGSSDEQRTEYAYSGANVLLNSVTVKRGDGSLAQTTGYAYNTNGQITEVDGPKLGTIDRTYHHYDALGRKIGVIGIDPDGSGSRWRHAIRTTYDIDGRISKEERGIVNGTTLSNLNTITVHSHGTHEFSSSTGLPIISRRFESNSLIGLTQTSYDSRMRTLCEAQRLNPSVFSTMASTSACSLGAAGPDGEDRIVRYYYKNNSVLASAVSGYGTPLARTDVYKNFNTNGTVSEIYDARNNKTAYYYDGFNRITKTCYPTPANGSVTNTTDCVQANYNTDGSVDNMVLRNNQTIYFQYDNLGRLITKSGAVSESISYNNYHQVTNRNNNGVAESYTYNSLGWLLTNTQPMGAVSYEYDPQGKRSQLTYPGGFNVTYNYNNGDELTGITTSAGASLTLGYDNHGRRSYLNRNNGLNTSYSYDVASRPYTLSIGTFNSITLNYTQADQIKVKTNTNSSFNYTPSGNATTSFTYDSLNRIAQVSGGMGFSAEHDALGNLTRDNLGTYSYNTNNLLTAATQSGVTSTLAYDAENRLYRTTRSGVSTQFLYDGNDLIAEYDGFGNLLRRYVHGPASDEPLLWYEGSGTSDVRHLHADHQGSIIATTNSSGALLNINKYDAYGLMQSTNPTYASRFSYTGQIWLGEVNLFYYNARMYNPRVGRFMQTDPIGYGDGMNWYAYVHGDPINRKDPTGLDDVATIPNPALVDEILVIGRRCSANDGCYDANTWLNSGLQHYISEPQALSTAIPSTAYENRGRGERGATGGSSGKNSNSPYKHCRETSDPKKITCKDHQTGQWIEKKKPADWGQYKNEICDGTCKSVVRTAATIGVGYFIYRGVRMAPSVLVPVLWPTIPLNAAMP